MRKPYTTFFFATMAAGTALLSACSGHDLSIGSNGATPQAVEVTAVSGTVVACAPGYAHPNVCCVAGPTASASCEVYPTEPFQQCKTGAQTLPDPWTCCPIDPSTGACVAPPPDDGGTAVGVGAGSGCTYACQAGFYQSAATCCAGGDQGTTCAPSPIAAACANESVCNCPAIIALPDGGEPANSCVCPPTPVCATPPPPQCAPCPTGWQVPDGEPGLCCKEQPSGVIDCFSQAVPPPPVTTSPAPDAGTPPVGCFCAAPNCPAGAPCAIVPCECDAGNVSPPPTQCTCSDPTCPADAPCVPIPCACDAGNATPPPNQCVCSEPNCPVGAPCPYSPCECSDASSGSPVTCKTASDCAGPVPALAEICPDGGTASGHWECKAGSCTIAFCE